MPLISQILRWAGMTLSVLSVMLTLWRMVPTFILLSESSNVGLMVPDLHINHLFHHFAPHLLRETTTDEMATISPSDWLVEDVVLFLRNISLDGYEDAFRNEDIDGFLLLNLDDINLLDLGISNSIHRKKLLHAVSKLRKEILTNRHSDFWDLRATNKDEVEVLASSLIYLPRCSFLYLLKYKHDEYLLPLLGGPVTFPHILMFLLFPNLIASYYALQFYQINRWVVPVFVFLSIDGFYLEYLLITTRSFRAFKNSLIGVGFSLMQLGMSLFCPPNVMSFIFYAAFLIGISRMIFKFVKLLLYLKHSHEKELEKDEKELLYAKEAEEQDRRILKVYHPKFDIKKINAPKINFNELEIEQELGKGYFGSVNLATWNSTKVAVKTIYRSTFRKDSDISLFYKELDILSQVRFPHCTNLLGYCIQKDTRSIVLEYLAGGTVADYLENNEIILRTEQELRGRFVLDVCKGLSFLHGKGIIHRDLTCNNLLLDENQRVKISDFGLSKLLEKHNSQMTCQMGSLVFQAPEVYRGNNYDKQADIFSLGMVTYQIFTLREPNSGMTPQLFALKVGTENFRPNLELVMFAKWRAFISKCWEKDPNLRPVAEQLPKVLEEMGVSDQAKSPRYIQSSEILSASGSSSITDLGYSEYE